MRILYITTLLFLSTIGLSQKSFITLHGSISGFASSTLDHTESFETTRNTLLYDSLWLSQKQLAELSTERNYTSFFINGGFSYKHIISDRLTLNSGLTLALTVITKDEGFYTQDVIATISTDTIVWEAPTITSGTGIMCDTLLNSYSEQSAITRDDGLTGIMATIPIELEYSVVPNKFFLAGGINFSSPLIFEERDYSISLHNYESFFDGSTICEYRSEVERERSGSINDFQVAVHTSLTYACTKNWAIEFKLSKHISNVFQHLPNSFGLIDEIDSFRPFSLSLGLEYHFGNYWKTKDTPVMDGL